MDIKELKNKIENNTLDTKLLILNYKGNGDFIVHQYLNTFINNNKLNIININSLDEIPKKTIFSIKTDNIYFLNSDEVSFDISIDTDEYVWISCKKIIGKKKKEITENIIEVPKLEDWQIKDYISSYCEKLSEDHINKLFSSYKKNLYRLENEIDKIRLFSTIDPFIIIENQLFIEKENQNIFDFSNAIIQKDFKIVSSIYSKIANIDIEPFGLLTVLINNFRLIISIQLSRNTSAESLNISGKQFWAIQKYSCNHYTAEQLVSIYKFLLSIDYGIKTGNIDTKNLIEYIICKIYCLGELK